MRLMGSDEKLVAMESPAGKGLDCFRSFLVGGESAGWFKRPSYLSTGGQKRKMPRFLQLRDYHFYFEGI